MASFLHYLDANTEIPKQFATLFTLEWCTSPLILCGSLKGWFSYEITTIMCCVRKASFQFSFITVSFQFSFYCCAVHHLLVLQLGVPSAIKSFRD